MAFALLKSVQAKYELNTKTTLVVDSSFSPQSSTGQPPSLQPLGISLTAVAPASIEAIVDDELNNFGVYYKDLLLWGGDGGKAVTDTTPHSHSNRKTGSLSSSLPNSTEVPSDKKRNHNVKKEEDKRKTKARFSDPHQHLAVTTERLDAAIADVATLVETFQQDILTPLRSILLTFVSNTSEYKHFLLNVVDAARERFKIKQRAALEAQLRVEEEEEKAMAEAQGRSFVSYFDLREQQRKEAEAEIEKITSGLVSPTSEDENEILQNTSSFGRARNRLSSPNAGNTDFSIQAASISLTRLKLMALDRAGGPLDEEEASYMALRHDVWVMPVAVCLEATENALKQVLSHIASVSTVCWSVAENAQQLAGAEFSDIRQQSASSSNSASTFLKGLSPLSSPSSSSSPLLYPNGIAVDAIGFALRQTPARLFNNPLETDDVVGTANDDAAATTGTPYEITREKQAILSALTETHLIQWSRITAFLLQLGMLLSDPNHAILASMVAEGLIGVLESEISNAAVGEAASGQKKKDKWGCFGIGDLGIDGIDMECESTAKLAFLFDHDSDDEEAESAERRRKSSDDRNDNNDAEDDDEDEATKSMSGSEERSKSSVGSPLGHSHHGPQPLSPGLGSMSSFAFEANADGDQQAHGTLNTPLNMNSGSPTKVSATKPPKPTPSPTSAANASAGVSSQRKDSKNNATEAIPTNNLRHMAAAIFNVKHPAVVQLCNKHFLAVQAALKEEEAVAKAAQEAEERLIRVLAATPAGQQQLKAMSAARRSSLQRTRSSMQDLKGPKEPAAAIPTLTFVPGPTLLSHLGKGGFGTRVSNLLFELCNMFLRGLSHAAPHFHYKSSNNFKARILLLKPNTSRHGEELDHDPLSDSPSEEGSGAGAIALQSTVAFFQNALGHDRRSKIKKNCTHSFQKVMAASSCAAFLEVSNQTSSASAPLAAPPCEDIAATSSSSTSAPCSDLPRGMTRPFIDMMRSTIYSTSSRKSGGVPVADQQRQPTGKQAKKKSVSSSGKKKKKTSKKSRGSSNGLENDAQSADESVPASHKKTTQPSAELVTPIALFTASHSLFCTAMGIVIGMLKEDATTSLGVSFCPATGPLRYYYPRACDDDGESVGDAFVWDGDFSRYRSSKNANQRDKSIRRASASGELSEDLNSGRKGSVGGSGVTAAKQLHIQIQLAVSQAKQWLFGGVPRSEAQYLQLMEDQQVSQEMLSACNDNIHKYQRGLHLTSQLVGEKGAGGTFGVAGGNGSHGSGPSAASSSSSSALASIAGDKIDKALAAGSGGNASSNISSATSAGAATANGVAVTALDKQGTLLLPVNATLHQSPFLTPEAAACAANGHTNNATPIATTFLPHIVSSPYNRLSCSLPINVPALVAVLRRLRMLAVGHNSLYSSSPPMNSPENNAAHQSSTIFKQLFPLLTTFRRTATTLNAIPRTAADDGTHQAPDFLIAAHACLTSLHAHLTDAFMPLITQTVLPDLLAAKWGDSHSKYYAGRSPTHSIVYFFTMLMRVVGEIVAIGHNERTAMRRRVAQEGITMSSTGGQNRGSISNTLAGTTTAAPLNDADAYSAFGSRDANGIDTSPTASSLGSRPKRAADSPQLIIGADGGEAGGDIGGIYAAHELLAMLVASVGKQLFLREYEALVCGGNVSVGSKRESAGAIDKNGQSAQHQHQMGFGPATKTRTDQLVGDALTVIKYSRMLVNIGVPKCPVTSSSRPLCQPSSSAQRTNHNDSAAVADCAKSSSNHWWNALVEVTHRFGSRQKANMAGISTSSREPVGRSPSRASLPAVLELSGNYAARVEEASLLAILASVSGRTTELNAIADFVKNKKQQQKSGTTDKDKACEYPTAVYEPTTFLKEFWFVAPSDHCPKRTAEVRHGAQEHHTNNAEEETGGSVFAPLSWLEAVEVLTVKEFFGPPKSVHLKVRETQITSVRARKSIVSENPLSVSNNLPLGITNEHQQQHASGVERKSVFRVTLSGETHNDDNGFISSEKETRNAPKLDASYSLAALADVTALMQFCPSDPSNKRFILNKVGRERCCKKNRLLQNASGNQAQICHHTRAHGRTGTDSESAPPASPTMPTGGKVLWPMAKLEAFANATVVPPLSFRLDHLQLVDDSHKSAAAAAQKSGKARHSHPRTLLDVFASATSLARKDGCEAAAASSFVESILPLRWEVSDTVSRSRLDDEERAAIDVAISDLVAFTKRSK